MPMSRCTNFSLANGKEEVSISWDLANGEITIKKNKIAAKVGDDEKNIFVCVRTTDLSPQEWIEMANAIYEAFGKLFTTFKNVDMPTAEKAEGEFGCSFSELESLLCHDDEEDDDEDDDEDDE